MSTPTHISNKGFNHCHHTGQFEVTLAYLSLSNVDFSCVLKGGGGKESDVMCDDGIRW